MQPDIRSAADFAEAFAVSREMIVKLETYAGLLSLWQKTINLVAPSTLENVWQRHFADSAQIVALAPAGVRTWVDLGSGGGFPGLGAAIMLADPPGGGGTPLGGGSRKAAFLGEGARKVRVAVDIRVARIEIVSTRAKLESVDVVSARALAPLDRLLGLSLPFWGATTVGLYLKGKGAAAELKAAEARFAFDAELRPSLTEAEAHCVVVRNLRERR